MAEFLSRVPGQVCMPELEDEISGPLKAIAENLNVKLAFPSTETKPTVAVGGSSPANGPAAAPPDSLTLTLLAN